MVISCCHAPVAADPNRTVRCLVFRRGSYTDACVPILVVDHPPASTYLIYIVSEITGIARAQWVYVCRL